MGLVSSKEYELEKADGDVLSKKMKDLIKTLNESVRDIGTIKVHYHGDFINMNSLMYFYVDCIYLDNNANLDNEIIDNCTNTLKLLVSLPDGSTGINPILQNHIQFCLQACAGICSGIPGCSNASYSLATINSSMGRQHPIGYKIIIYPILQ